MRSARTSSQGRSRCRTPFQPGRRWSVPSPGGPRGSRPSPPRARRRGRLAVRRPGDDHKRSSPSAWIARPRTRRGRGPAGARRGPPLLPPPADTLGRLPRGAAFRAPCGPPRARGRSRAREDAERLAWHLAGGALGLDEEAATALEAAARQAEQRSSYAAAAAAFERAAGLTADEDARPRRLYAAADAALRAGRADDALAFLAEPLAQERTSCCAPPRSGFRGGSSTCGPPARGGYRADRSVAAARGDRPRRSRSRSAPRRAAPNSAWPMRRECSPRPSARRSSRGATA